MIPRAVAWAERKHKAAERRAREEVELLCDACQWPYKAKRVDLQPQGKQVCGYCSTDAA